MSKEDYGSDWWYSKDFIFTGNYNRLAMKVVAYHPPGTVRTEQGEVVDKPVIELQCKSTVKKLSINVSNDNLGTLLFGEPVGEKWVGRDLICEVRMILFKGDPTASIRIIPKGRQLERFKENKWLGCRADLNKRYEVGKYKGAPCVVEAGDLAT